MARPTNAEAKRRRVAALVAELESAEIEVAVEALEIVRDKTASASVRVQAMQLVRGMAPNAPERTEGGEGTPLAPSEEGDDTPMKMLRLLIRLGLWGDGPVPIVDAPANLKTITEMHPALDARIAELDAKELDLRERAARVGALQKYLDDVERRDLSPALLPSESQPPTPAADGDAEKPEPPSWWPSQRTTFPRDVRPLNQGGPF